MWRGCKLDCSRSLSSHLLMRITLSSETSGQTNLYTRVLRPLIETWLSRLLSPATFPLQETAHFFPTTARSRVHTFAIHCNVTTKSQVSVLLVTFAALRFATRAICAARGFSGQSAGCYVVAPDLVWTSCCSRFAVAEQSSWWITCAQPVCQTASRAVHSWALGQVKSHAVMWRQKGGGEGGTWVKNIQDHATRFVFHY